MSIREGRTPSWADVGKGKGEAYGVLLLDVELKVDLAPSGVRDPELRAVSLIPRRIAPGTHTCSPRSLDLN